MDRRRFLGAAVVGMAVAALAERALARDVLEAPIAAPVLAWLREVAAAGNGVRGARLSPQAWQEAIAELNARVPLVELLAAIDFEALVERLVLPHDRAGFADPRLPDIDGLPRWPDCGLRVFGMARGTAIVPHGHANMVSAHLVVQGAVHVRHWQRLADEADALRLRPTIDRHARPGDATSISDHGDNVHWLIAESARAYTLDFIVLDIDRERTTRWGDFVDIRAATTLADGSLRAPRLDAATALARYGREPWADG